MDADTAEEEHLQDEDSDDSCVLEYIEIVPLPEDADGFHTIKEEETLQEEDSDDSCVLEYIEILPLIRDTDGSSISECVRGDWSAEVTPENLVVVKQEPDDVRCVIYVIFSLLKQKQILQMIIVADHVLQLFRLLFIVVIIRT